MVYRGRVKNGVIELEMGPVLPDGTEVRVEPFSREEGRVAEAPTLAEQFADVIGAVPDMSARHDHYLHGAPAVVFQPRTEGRIQNANDPSVH
ncbi:MAG: hypothetical protein WCB27_16680 [Thermoguttaceae bacterium]